MDRTVLYAVRSDLEGITDAPLYAEFTDEQSAIEYAKAHVDALPYVDRLAVTLDEFGRVDEVSKLDTVWVYSEADDADELGEALADGKPNITRKEMSKLYGQGPVSRASMKDTLYKNYTGVGEIQYEDLSTEAATSDNTFKLDFPEYQKTARGPVLVSDTEDVEAEDEEIEFTAEEAVPYLIDDEKEAISSYAEAIEVVEEADLENKEEILALLKQIQEEEEEHLEELIDLLDEDEDDETDVDDADETDEDDTDSEELTEDMGSDDSFDAYDFNTSLALMDKGFDDEPSGDSEDAGGTEDTANSGEGSDPRYALDRITKVELDPDLFNVALDNVGAKDAGEVTTAVVPADGGFDVEPVTKELNFSDNLGAAVSDIKAGARQLGSNVAGTVAGKAAAAQAGVAQAADDLSELATLKTKLKKARLQTQINREEAAGATQTVKINAANKRAAWQNVGTERAKAAAAETAAKSRLRVAGLDTNTTKEIAKQSDSVRNAYADLETAKLQNKAQGYNVSTARKLAKQTDDVIKSRSDREAAWNQLQAQRYNAATAKNLAKQTDDVILARSNKLANDQNNRAAMYRNHAERVKADTVKQMAKQEPEVSQAYTDKFANIQNDRAAKYKNHEERTKANTVKYTALQDPAVKRAEAELAADKVRHQDAKVQTAIEREVAKQNPELDQAHKERAVQRVKLGTSQINNWNSQLQNKEVQDLKKDIRATKLQKKLASAEKDLRDYENKHNLRDEPLQEDALARGVLPKRTKEYFRMLVNDYQPVVIFHEKFISAAGVKNPFSLNSYAVKYDGYGYEVDVCPWASDCCFDETQATPVAYFQTYDEFWEYLKDMISQPDISPEYNYIFTEGLHESMIITEAVVLQNASVPKMTRSEFEALLLRDGAVQVYHENPATFGLDTQEYFVTATPTGAYEVVSEDNKGRIDTEGTFKTFDDLYEYLLETLKNTYLYRPDIVLM